MCLPTPPSWTDFLSKKKKIKNRNSKNDSKLTVINDHTKNKNKSKLGKQLEQEQNHRNGGHMEGYQQGNGRGRVGERYRE